MGKKRQPANARDKTLLKRLLPPLVFILGLCLLVVCFYDAGYSALPPTEKRYSTAKADIEKLKLDDKRAAQRAPWEKLVQEFTAIYESDPAWPNRAAALFRAAESLEELARRSFAKSDLRKAVEAYEKLALKHADSRLADDALFRAARLRAAWLKDDKGALELLTRLKSQYPRGDMLAQAQALEKALKAAADGRTAPEARQAALQKESEEDQPMADTSQAAAKVQNSGIAPKFNTGSADLKVHPAVPDQELLPRYRAAKSRLDELRADKVRSCWREPWEELREEFLRIYAARRSWAVTPGALFRAAASQEALALCAHVPAEFRRAVKLYEKVATEFPDSSLADDALLRAAALEAGNLDARDVALTHLDHLLSAYPGGDMVAEARSLRNDLRNGLRDGLSTAEPLDQGSSSGQARNKPAPAAAEKSEVQVLSWDSLSKDSVEIVLELSGPARYNTRLEKAAKGRPARLHLELENADVAREVRQGVTVRGSLLQAVRVREGQEGRASLQFDFREVRRFDARSESEPCRIVLNVAAGKASLPRHETKKAGFAEQDQPAPQRPAQASATRQVSNMASQLGLSVRTVFIDAGHGGRDPGTSHNNVLERLVTMDVASTLGRFLEANGLDVVYSRRNDSHVSLSERTGKANAAGADLFVSIHINANDDRTVNGFETYYLDLAGDPQAARVAALENSGSDRRLGDMQKVLADVMLSARMEESRSLAGDIQRLSLFRLKRRGYESRNNGAKSAPFHVLLGAQMPAVLVELGYCTNSAEARNLADPKYRHTLAEGLAEGVLAYKDRLLKRQSAQVDPLP